MQQAQSLPYSFTCIDSGVDWITCTAAGKDARRALEAETEAILQTETAAGVEIKPAAVRDYVGWRVPGVFAGRRAQDSIAILSASHAARLWKRVAQHATNVSRLDLQATLWTHGEQPALSRWYYQRARRLPPKRGRPRSFSLIQSHPHGDTLYVGKRQSDCFGRVYDFASAHAHGTPRTLWRYEVEFKRHLARRHSATLSGSVDDRTQSELLVASWYLDRGLLPAWSVQESPASQGRQWETKQRDVLRWFETSLSKTVASAIRRYGLPAVLDSLHLSGVVIPKPKEDTAAYANHATSTLSGEANRRTARPVDGDALLASWRRQFTGKHGRG